jgi:hypothetical protein
MHIYLYVKRHSVTGLKYFGKTIQNPYTYLGSGKHWSNHIAKHGKEHVETLNVWSFNDQAECANFASQFSINYNIVESKEWANLIPEDGINNPPSPLGKKPTRDSIEKSRRARIGQKRNKETREKMSVAAKGKKRGPITESRRSNISKARTGKQWFTNPERTKCTCCYPGSEPEGWTRGLLKFQQNVSETAKKAWVTRKANLANVIQVAWLSFSGC